MNDPAAPCAQSARQRQSRLGGRCSVGAHICGGSRPCLKLALEFANQLPNPSTLRRRRFAPESWDGGGAPSLPFGTKGASNAQSARQRPSKINGRDAALSGSHFCGGSRPCLGLALERQKPVSDSHAPRGRRCAPESWDDTEVIPPLGTMGHQPRRWRGSASRSSGGRCSVGADFCGGGRPYPLCRCSAGFTQASTLGPGMKASPRNSLSCSRIGCGLAMREG